MRISDWRSDVCSSDLGLAAGIGLYVPGLPDGWQHAPVAAILSHTSGIPEWDDIVWDRPWPRAAVLGWAAGRTLDFAPGTARSEEHTSELQSLMRISYAVFCLKKKITHTSLTQVE